MGVKLQRSFDLPAVQRVNAMFPDDFLKLTDRELKHGHWWLAIDTGEASTVAGFCGFVDFEPFDGYVYLKRAGVLPQYRGQGLQNRMITVREDCAREIGKTHVITETELVNTASSNNMAVHGYTMFRPMRPWTAEKEVPYIYWIKRLIK